MTSIHASIPSELKEAVLAAKRRGEEAGTEVREDTDSKRVPTRKVTTSSQVVMKQRPQLPDFCSKRSESGSNVSSAQSATMQSLPNDHSSEQVEGTEAPDDDNDETTAAKENDPSLSPSPVSQAFPSPRRNTLGKRPLSDLPTPIDPDADEDEDNVLSPSERNIANNAPYFPSDQRHISTPGSRPRKSPKLAERSKAVNSSGRLRDDIAPAPIITPFEDADTDVPHKECVSLDEGKENVTEGNAWKGKSAVVKKSLSSAAPAKPAAAGRKVSAASTSSAGSGKNAKPRIGLRRL